METISFDNAAYTAGKRAYLDDGWYGSYLDNPHRYGTVAWSSWAIGFNDEQLLELEMED